MQRGSIRKTITIIVVGAFLVLVGDQIGAYFRLGHPPVEVPKETWEVETCSLVQVIYHNVGAQRLSNQLKCLQPGERSLPNGVTDKNPDLADALSVGSNTK